MNNTHLYLSLVPQALVASMLEPAAFGRYYAVGSRVHSRGEAVFFELDPTRLPAGEFPLESVAERCVAKADGSPKKSVYLAIYRVLSRIPVAALGKLYLVTRDGLTLALERTQYSGGDAHSTHLYQEFCPVDPMVASLLEPLEFCRAITDPGRPVHVPRIVFAEMALQGLAKDPASGLASDLPYPNIDHLRDVLGDLLRQDDGKSKLFLKQASAGAFYRMIQGGFYVGDQQDFAFYRFPAIAELESHHFSWWRAAQSPAFEY